MITSGDLAVVRTVGFRAKPRKSPRTHNIPLATNTSDETATLSCYTLGLCDRPGKR